MASDDALDLYRSGYSPPWLGVVWLWAFPSTSLGLAIGLAGLCTGGKCRRIGHTLEFHGGFVNWFLNRTPISASGMTLGHVIIGRSASVLDFIRFHEWVHVRQYERWGPLFLPAYLSCSLWLYLSGRNFYLDNPFEVEAYAADHQRLAKLDPVDDQPTEDA